MSYARYEEALLAFDVTLPIEESSTPPYSWYTEPAFYDQEVRRVFQRCWIPVGRIDQVLKPGDYFTADVAGNPIVVVRDHDQQLKAHHNVCRHKAAIVASEEDDSQHRCEFFQCPYHGWEYHLDGRLKKAPMLGPQENFDASRHGLTPVAVDTWGPFVFVDLDGPLAGANNPRNLHQDLQPIKAPLEELGFEHLRFFRRYEYDLNCNWKVFVDNSLDGGYHVKYAHQGLAEGLDMEQFATHIHDRTSIQICDATGGDQRLGQKVMYAFLFPNFFINRYGRMMDTNIVMPLAVDRCRIIFDFYFDYEDPESWETRKSMRKSIASSHTIQEEDIEICESAQRGMNSMAFHVGRYSSLLERAVHAFHGLLSRELQGLAG